MWAQTFLQNMQAPPSFSYWISTFFAFSEKVSSQDSQQLLCEVWAF